MWPESYFRKSDPFAATFLPQSLFTIHADLIRDQLREDIAANAPSPFPAAVVELAADSIDEGIRATADTKEYPSLGFNPDVLKERDSAVGRIRYALGGDAAAGRFCDYYYWRVWQRHPSWMLAKIWRQLRVFYHFSGCPAYNMPGYDLRAAYQQTVAVLEVPERAEKMARFRSYMERCAVLTGTAPMIESLPGYRCAMLVLGSTHLLSCLLAAALAAAFQNAAARALLWLYSVPFAIVLALAIGHSLDVGRYSLYQLALIALPQIACLWLCGEAALRATSPRSSRSAARS